MIDLRTILGFLLMDQRAIRVVALSKTATIVGLLFVISAGFAREYDGEDLMTEPWHLLLPLAASVIGCFLLSILLNVVGWRAKEEHVGFFHTFRSFLNVYWMTAPMAWLYAIPVERILSPGNATRANLILLAIVATWRVVLMIRSVCVLYRCSIWTGVMPVMLFSASLALLALWLVPGPIFMIMGGVRLTESEAIIQETRFTLGFAATISLPIWLIGYAMVAYSKNKLQTRLVSGPLPLVGASRGTWALTLASLAIWIPILPFTQPEQQNRRYVEKLIRNSQFEDLCRWLGDKEKSDFPTHWDPPPRISYGEREPNLLEVAIGLREFNAPSWLIKTFDDKIVGTAIDHGFGLHHTGLKPLEMNDEELSRFVTFMQSVDYGPRLAKAAENWISLELTKDEDGSEPLPAARRDLFLQIQTLAEQQAVR